MDRTILKLMQRAESLLGRKRMKSAKMVYDRMLTLEMEPADRAQVLYQAAVFVLDELGGGVEAVRLFDEYLELLKTHPELQSHAICRTFMAYTCENRMLLSLSYDEYDRWATALRELSPDEPILHGQVPLIHQHQSSGAPWSEQLEMIATSYYNRNDPKLDPGKYGRAAGTYELLLANRRQLRVTRQDWSNVIYEYVALMEKLNMVATRSMEESGTIYPDECLFYLEAARTRLDEFFQANTPDQVITRLSESLNELLDMSPQSGPTGLSPIFGLPLEVFLDQESAGDHAAGPQPGHGLISWQDQEELRRGHPEIPGRARLLGSCMTTLSLLAAIVYFAGRVFGWW